MSNFFTNKSVLITGGLGFIGSNLAIRLNSLGSQVTIVDSLIPDYGGNLFNVTGVKNDLHINISDVRDEHSLKFLIRDQDIIFNLAGQTSHMDSMKNPFTDLEINAKAQLSILECCRKYNPDVKIVFASTRQIYGKPDYLPVDEKHPLKPVDVNGINKMAGEGYHILYNNVYGIRAACLRLTNTYGPAMRVKDAKQTFLGIWIKSAIENSLFEVWGGDQMRDYNYVEDVVDAFLLAGSNEISNGKTYNLGSTEILSLKETAELLIKANGNCGYEVKQFPLDRKKIDIGDYYSDYSLIKKNLGWEPKTTFSQGIRMTLEYYRQHIDKYL